MLEKMPDGRDACRTVDGSLIPLQPVNVNCEVTMTTAIVAANGSPQVLPVGLALAIQTTMAMHWFAKWNEQQTVIADLKAQLNEAHSEGRVYELDGDIEVSVEEFGRMKDTLTALWNYFAIKDAGEIEAMYATLHAAAGQGGVVPVSDELAVACRKLGFTSAGGLRAFLEAHNLRREAALVDG